MPSQPSHILHNLRAQWKLRFSSSLKGRLIVLSISLFVPLLWAMVLLSSSIQQRQLSEVLFDQQFAMTQRVAADLDNKLRERLQILSNTAAKLPAALVPSVLHRHLTELPGVHTIFSAGIMVIGLDGKSIADFPAAPERRGVYYGDLDYFAKVVATRKPYIGKPVIGHAHKPTVLNIAVPVFDGADKLRAVMVGVTDLTAPNFLGYVIDRTISGNGEFFIVSLHDNVIVAATDPDRVMTAPPARGINPMYDHFADGGEGSGISVSSKGVSKLYSGKHIPIAGWLVMAGLPTDIAFRPVTAMQIRLAGAAAILTLLAIFLILKLTRHMLAPLDDAGKAMQKVAEGSASRAPLPVERLDEISGLIDNFNVLAEDRHRHQAALAASEQRFRVLVENAPDAIVVIARGRFTYVNAAAVKMLGASTKEDLLGLSVLARIHPDNRHIAEAHMREINYNRTVIPPVEEKLLQLDGSVVYAEVSAIPFHYENEDGALVFVRDISYRKRAMKALRESEDRFHRLVALSSEWYWELDDQYRFTQISGWDTLGEITIPAQLLGKTRWEISANCDASIWAAHREVLDARLPFRDFEYASVTATGHQLWFSINGEPQFDEKGVFTGYRGTGKNISRRKRAEEVLRQSQARIRELAAHQEQVKEDERKRIARDIHDDLGQMLLTLRLDVSTFAARIQDTHPRMHHRLEIFLARIDATMRSVKRIINDLRPSVLDLGLLAAMEWQTREFQRSSGIACMLDVEDDNFDRYLDENRSAALFRVVQESLANIIRHARASEVHIAVRMVSGALVMTISDDGVGFVPESVCKKNSFGLVGIDERISALGGKFSVDSASGKGTTLKIVVPMEAPVC